MNRFFTLLPAVFWCASELHAQSESTEGENAGKSQHGRPALLESKDLQEFDSLPADRKKVISRALEIAKNAPWKPYRFGGSDPETGFDCSGAMYYVMQQSGLKPPRTSADQYEWVRDADRLHAVPKDTTDNDHASLDALKPGDLMFWSGTYQPSDGRKTNITHVAMFLGHEKKDGRAVMINATDGRSYRGKQANGFGVYDFRLPSAGSKSVFMGYGTPPGLAADAKPAAPAASEPDAPNEESSPTRLIEAWTQAIKDKDSDALLEIYGESILRHDPAETLRTQGKDTVRKTLAAWLDAIPQNLLPAIELRDLKIEEAGDLAFASALVHLPVKPSKNAPVRNAWLRATFGLRQQDGVWRIVHEHLSAPAGQDSGKALLNLKP